MVKNKCALMQCEIEDNTPTLNDIVNNIDTDYDNCVIEQARCLLDEFHFNKEDRFCIDCFWK